MKPTGESRLSDRVRRIDAACDRFEADWRAGGQPRIADYLDAAGDDPLMREQLLDELELLERELTRESNGGNGPDEPEPGDRIGRYVVLARLDEGGEANVYRVLHVELGRPLILKIARRRLDPTRSKASHDRLAAEGRLLAGLDHPGLVRVIDLDMHQGCPYLVMEHVPGLNLSQHASRGGLDARRASAIVAESARVLAYLHDRGIVHRDITPRNILIDESGRVRIIDLGLARLRDAWSEPAAAAVAGTLAYMAPEQFDEDRDRVDERTDVFGLGAVLYELLCGQPPHQAETIEELADAARAVRIVPPRQVDRRVPHALEAICLRALARDPADRFVSADAMERALRRYLRRRYMVTAVVVPLLMVLAALVWVFASLGSDSVQDQVIDP